MSRPPQPPRDQRRDGQPHRTDGRQNPPQRRESPDLERPPLPRETADAWERACRAKLLVNPGLLFDRYATRGAILGDREGATPRRDHLTAVCSSVERIARDHLLSAFSARWEAMVRAAGAEPLALPLQARLVTGLGSGGPLEIGFRFNRLGIPVLPGSGVKGVARAYAELVEGLDETHPDFLAVFGRAPKKGESAADAQAGQLVFFDAFPVEHLRLELDVMTPHYPEYYQGKAPPTPWQNPTPITFLTLAPGTVFRFAIGLRLGVTDPDGRLRALATGWLRGGLAELGFGAKTTSGYGRFAADAGERGR